MSAERHATSAETLPRQYHTLLEIADAITAHTDVNSLLQDLAGRLRAVVESDGINVLLYNEERAAMQLYGLVAEAVQAQQLIPELPLDEAPAGLVWQTQQPLLMRDLRDFASRYPKVIPEALNLGIQSAYVTPLTSANRRLGVLAFGSYRKDAYSAEQQTLLQQVAKLVAVALDNTLNFASARRAEAEAKRRSEALQLLLEINNAVVSTLDLRELLKVISPCLRRVVRHDFAALLLYDAATDQLRAHALDFPGHPMTEGLLFDMDGTPSGLAFRTRQPVLVTRQMLDQFGATPLIKLLRAQGVQSGCSLPLLSHEQTLGVLTVMSLRTDNFSQHELELLAQIAGQIAIAVNNALNFERTRAAEAEAKRQTERLQLMLELNNAVVSQLSLRELARVTADRLRAALRHDVTGISLYDPEINQFRAYMFDLPDHLPPIEEGTLMPLEGSVGGLAFMTGQAVFMSRPEPQHVSSEFDQRLTAAGVQSGGVVPLIAHDKKLGFLGVGSFHEDFFSPADQELLCHIANQIALAVENALAFQEIEKLKNKLASEKLYLEDEIRTQSNFEELIGESPTFRRILKQVETVAPTDSTVLIRGETGTGKELIARAIHALSTRRERTLVKINCAAIPTGLLESELFGHEKGAFTGAIAQRIGRFELAHQGTLLLDEVGDIPLELQSKLLRVLQEQEFERLGSTRTQRVNVRLIAATNCDLEQMVAERKYRSDLFYRLNVFPITIPPLRQRREDIPALARFFTQKYARRLKKTITAIPAAAMAALTAYHWPGNVRELEHFIERAVILTRGAELEVSLAELKTTEPAPTTTNLPTLETAEREHILRALEETNWVIGGPHGAAAKLGLKRTTLQSRMQKLGIAR